MGEEDRAADGLERRLAEASRRLLAAAAAPEAAEAPDARGLRQLAGTLDRWMQAATLSRWFRTSGSDVVTAPGVEVELVAQVGSAVRLRATEVVFEIDGRSVARAPIDPDRSDVRASFVPDGAGVAPIVVRAVDRHGRTVAGARREEIGRLYVFEDAPVVAVALFEAIAPAGDIEPSVGRALEPWCEAGFEPIYLATTPPDGLVELRRNMEAAALPAGPILVPPELSRGFRDLGVDFRATFASIVVRRVRARGVPVVAVLGAGAQRAPAALGGCEAFDWEPPPSARTLARLRTVADALRRAHRTTGGGVEFRVEQMTGASVVAGNAVRVEFDGRRARERWFELVEGARRTIHLQTYIFRSGRFADELGARLVRRAREGVSVRILVDGLYGAPEAVIGRNGVLRIMGEEPNVDVRLRDPVAVSPTDPRVWKHRDHRKILVVDGRVGIVGGRNVGDEYFTGFDEVAVGDWTPSERVPWLDAHAEVEGPAAALLDRAFVDAWTAQAGDPGPAPFVTTEVRPAGDARVRVVLHEGLGDGRALGLFEALFDGARDRIYVVNDFPVTETLADALLRARRRGVRVVLLTGSAVARRGDGKMLPGVVHRELFEYMTKDRFEPLLRRGVEIREYVAPRHSRIVCTGGVVRPYVHAKVVVVDGEHATVGSANLDATASYWEREANLVLHGAEVVGPIEAAVEAMLEDALVVDPASPQWVAESAFRRIARAVWPDTLYS